MDLELVFSLAGVLSMTGWLLLLASPRIPVWSDRIAGLIIPAVLSLVYIGLLTQPTPENGGFGSLQAVMVLFSQGSSALAGWLHFLAFDLLVGAWICRMARRDGMPFWRVIPCLALTFLIGPAGFVLFLVLRPWRAWRMQA